MQRIDYRKRAISLLEEHVLQLGHRAHGASACILLLNRGAIVIACTWVDNELRGLRFARIPGSAAPDVLVTFSAGPHRNIGDNFLVIAQRRCRASVRNVALSCQDSASARSLVSKCHGSALTAAAAAEGAVAMAALRTDAHDLAVDVLGSFWVCCVMCLFLDEDCA